MAIGEADLRAVEERSNKRPLLAAPLVVPLVPEVPDVPLAPEVPDVLLAPEAPPLAPSNEFSITAIDVRRDGCVVITFASARGEDPGEHERKKASGSFLMDQEVSLQRLSENPFPD